MYFWNLRTTLFAFLLFLHVFVVIFENYNLFVSVELVCFYCWFNQNLITCLIYVYRVPYLFTSNYVRTAVHVPIHIHIHTKKKMLSSDYVVYVSVFFKYVFVYFCLCFRLCVLRSLEEARAAQAALAKATAEAERLDRKLKRLDKAFVCTICCTNEIDTILATCGHMLCSSW